MSFQADLDNIEAKTGKAPEEFIQLANDKGFSADSDVAEIAAWLTEEFRLSHDQLAAMIHVITHGTQMSDRHVGSAGSHREETDVSSPERKPEG